VKFLPLLAATALILPTVAVAQSAPDGQAAPAKSKHGKKHKDTMTAPDSSAAPADSTVAPAAADPTSSAPAAPSAEPPSSTPPTSTDPSAAPTPPRF